MANTPQSSAEGAGSSNLSAGPRGNWRFRIFIIDTGWHSVAHKVIEQNLSVLEEIVREDPIYVVDRATSVELLRGQQQLIGRDPIICVHDVRALERSGMKEPHGFRLHLGLVRREDQVLRALQMFARFISAHRQSDRLEADVRKSFRREGFVGAIEIMMGKDADHLVTLK